jgi:nucleoside-diphosphate-sugar epimerase
MRVLVTGASGFVGTALCRELLARGHTVRAAVRGASPPQSLLGLQHVLVPDLATNFDRRALLGNIDVVVHLAAVAHRAAGEEEIRRTNVDATLRLAEFSAGSVRRFIFLSTVKVHGADSGTEAYSEGTSLRPEDSYGRSKLEAEQALMDVAARSGMELVLLRSPLVYGPRVKANFLRLLHWVDSGRPLPLASVRNRRSLIYLGNLIDVIARCAEHPAARGAFLVSDNEAVSTPELVTRTARAFGGSPRLFPVPIALLRLAGTITGRTVEVRSLTGNLLADPSKARRLLDWQPPYTLDQGLAETARWFRSGRISA